MSKMDRLIIIGAGGHSKVCLDIAIQMNLWSSIEFLDDFTDESHQLGYPIIGKISDFPKLKNNSHFFVAIGDNKIRRETLLLLKKSKCLVATLIHPTSVVGLEVNVGCGTVIMPNVVINSSTIIGEGCIINSSSIIEHDNCISGYVHISPGAHLAGNVSIGEQSWIGIAATVINNVSIKKNIKIGAGAVVTNDISVEGTYVGVPAVRIV